MKGPLVPGDDALELTILMPCLNEAETLQVCIEKAQGFLKRADIRGEVLIADNGSTDGSQEIAKRLGARVVDIPVKGYGAALIGGIAAAKGTYVIMGDADDSYDFSRLDAFVERLRAGDQLVMGNRFKGGIAPGAMPPLHKYLGNPVLSTIGRVLFRSAIRDFHCGLRGFHRESIAGLHLITTGMEFASEMVVKATLADLRIAEVPTTLAKDGRSRPPHLRSWRDGWRHLRFLLVFSPGWLYMIPGAVLGGLGLVGTLVLAVGPVKIGEVGLSSVTQLYLAAATMVGYQALLFFVLTKLYAQHEGFHLPRGTRGGAFLERFTVERAAFAGALLFLVGFVAAFVQLLGWSSAGFGELDATKAMSAAIPGALAMMLGMQTVMAGFFAGVLSVPVRRD